MSSSSLQPARPTPAAPPPGGAFRVTCRCGHRLEGRRRAEFQVLPCPKCGRKLLVFPASPLRALFEPSSRDAPIVVPSPLSGRRISPWAVGILALLLVGVTLGVLLWTSEAPPGERSSPPERLREHRAAAEEALRQGDYDRLARACAEALALDDRQPGLLSPGERRHLRQLGAQAAVLRDLLFESLPEVLRTAPGVPDAVWAAEFERRYRGKAVVFDALMHRDAAGEYHLDYALFTREGEVRVLWHEVELFRRLPLEEPRRLIFGARLASASRDATGRWQVRLQPGGTVLFTDPEMFTGTTLPPADDETRAVLRRQAEWLAEIGQ